MIYKLYIGGRKVLETRSREKAVKRFLRAAQTTKATVRLTHEDD